MRIEEWATNQLGMPDTWTALCVNKAVLYFGTWIENQLSIRDKHGNQLHTLKRLLTNPDEIDNDAAYAGLVGTFPVRTIRTTIGGSDE